jgi:hypothetical protein
MRIEVDGNVATVIREPGEPRARSESDFFYRLRDLLRQHGEDVIKKEMAEDGHMVSDGIYYVRMRSAGPDAYAIWDGRYTVRDTAEDFNAGHVRLMMEYEKPAGIPLRERRNVPLEWARV